jgi:hypothetical protein
MKKYFSARRQGAKKSAEIRNLRKSDFTILDSRIPKFSLASWRLGERYSFLSVLLPLAALCMPTQRGDS